MAALSAPNYPVAQQPPSYKETAGFNNSAGTEEVFFQKPLSYDSPMQMQCPSCNRTVVTRVLYKPGTLTWLTCGGLCLCGCWLGCCLIPFLVDPLLDVQHYCPSCNALLGIYKRL